MTPRIVPPLLPAPAVARTVTSPGAGRLPTLLPVATPAIASVYAIATVSASGRICDTTILRALDWHPGTAIEFATTPAALMARSPDECTSPDSVITSQGFLAIPVAFRRRIGLPTGVRVLIAAYPDAARLLVLTPSALDVALAPVRTQLFPGEPG